MFENGDRIRFPDPLAEGKMVEGTFLEIATGQPVEVPSSVPGAMRLADTAWVRRADDDTTAQVVYEKIRRA